MTPEDKQPEQLKNIIAPSSLEIDPSYIKLGNTYARTLFIFTYPRYLSVNWFSPIINMGSPIDISIFIHPTSTEKILKNLQRQITNVESELSERESKGLVRDPMLETAYRNIEDLRDRLQQSEERMFRFGLYITLYGDSEKMLEGLENDVRAVLESRLVYMKPAQYQQSTGFHSTLPILFDELQVHNSLNTGPLSSTFPFVSFDLTSDKGVLYGINRHNSSLILFDRFSLENANSVIFGKSGGGKSYAVKLEILRSLMFDTDVIVIDPENEYKNLAETAGGEFFNISLASEHHINPMELPPVGEDETTEDVLRENVIALSGLLKVMMGDVTAEEASLLDRAITETYAEKGITFESETFEGVTYPLLGDLHNVLQKIEGAESLSLRLERYTKGIYAGFLNQPSNINFQNRFVVFSIRDMEEELRPVAMYLVLHYIWNTIRKTLKKRILVVDEMWILMQHEESAEFLFGIAKRARKYFLGLTAISQDVTDVLNSNYGKPIVTNSSIQLLLKQSPASMDIIQSTFNLTDEEKYLLLEGAIGEGLFFAGLKHVAIKVIASHIEDQIITSDPEQLLRLEKIKKEELGEE